MSKKILIILEMANNHMGDLDHGKLIINEFAKVVEPYRAYFNFALKFQFRDLDTFIHKTFKNRLDHKYVKRFQETNLSNEQFFALKKLATQKNFLTMCTGFDEPSIDKIIDFNFDIIKVASCSFTDWPLLNKIIQTDKPLILSTAGTYIEDVDRVVSFLQHRNKTFTLLHCVGEYPTRLENLQLNQIDLLKQRYVNVPIGYSTHELPNELQAIQIAIAKGIVVAEKHIAVKTEKYTPNDYSVTPSQLDAWLNSALNALKACGSNSFKTISQKETNDLLQFKRGVFCKRNISKGECITRNDVYYAWPSISGQVLANDMSKYNQYIAETDLENNSPLLNLTVSKHNHRETVWNIVQKIKNFLKETGVVYPGQAELEISHHYGIQNFYETGITMLTVVNRDYCKKLIIVLPGQTHPEQYHNIKEETFVILHGELELFLNNQKTVLKKGDVLTVERNVRHKFTSEYGCVIEEISSTHFVNDSFYTDSTITDNKDRKTFVTHWL